MAKKFYIIDGHENKNHHKLDLTGVSDEDIDNATNRPLAW